MSNIGFTTVTFRQKSFDEVLATAKSANIKFLEVGGDIHLPDGDIALAGEVKEKLDSNEIKAISYGSYYRVGSEDFDSFKRICQISFAIGSSVIRIWLGEKSSSKTSEHEFFKMVYEVQALSDIAEEYKQTIAFEFHNNTYNDNGTSCNKFINTCNRDNVKTYWQPLYNGNDLDNLTAVLPHLITIHVFHWSKNGKRYSLKRGKKEWQDYINIVKKANINCSFILEFSKNDSEKYLFKDTMILRELLNKSVSENCKHN